MTSTAIITDILTHVERRLALCAATIQEIENAGPKLTVWQERIVSTDGPDIRAEIVKVLEMTQSFRESIGQASKPLACRDKRSVAGPANVLPFRPPTKRAGTLFPGGGIVG